MFMLKKIIASFLLPIPIGIFLLLVSLWFLLKNSYKKAKIFLIFSLLWFLLLSSQIVSDALITPLERSFNALLVTPDVEYIVVLGNCHSSDGSLSITSQLNSTAINRLAEGVRHYNNLRDATLIVSGYSGGDRSSHAMMQEVLAKELGVKKIIRLDTPRDTLEEAKEVKKIVGTKEFILVTSASHMPRAVRLFKKEHLNFYPSPTNHKAVGDIRFEYFFSASNLKKCELAFHEYLGMLYSFIRDEI